MFQMEVVYDHFRPFQLHFVSCGGDAFKHTSNF